MEEQSGRLLISLENMIVFWDLVFFSIAPDYYYNLPSTLLCLHCVFIYYYPSSYSSIIPLLLLGIALLCGITFYRFDGLDSAYI